MLVEENNVIAYLTRPGLFEFRITKLDGVVPPHYVRIKITHCGLCGTDISFFLGHRDEGYPICLGHEHCGVVVDRGKLVKKLMVGDSVAVDPNYRCGQCQFCRNHLSHLCDRGTEQYYSNRGYAQYVDIDESYVHKLPRFREPFIGALVEPLSVALNATSTLSTQDEKGDVLILGAGSIGSLIAFAILSLSDADVTMHDRSGEKLDRLRSIYGQRVRPLSSNEAMSFRTIIEATGHGAGFGVACDRLAKDGHIVIVSRYHSSEPRIPDRLPWKAPRITFAHLNGDGVAFLQAAELLFTKWTPAHDVLLECLPFRDINQAFEAFDQGTFNKKLIKMGPD